MNRLVCATAALAAIATPAVGAAQSSADAESLFREARALVKAGRLAEGCDAFESSQRIEPTVPTLLNLADCRERNQQLASAWGHFVAAAQQTRGDRAQAAAQATARRRAAALEPRLSYLVVAVPDDSRVDGLIVSRNGVALDPGMWNRSLPVDGGDYVVEGKAPGHEPWSTRVTVAAANDRRSVEVPRFKALPALSPVAPPVTVIAPVRAGAGQPVTVLGPAAAPLMTGRRWVAVGVAGLGAASLVTAAVLGNQARAAEDDAFALCPDGMCVRADDATAARTLHGRAQDRALIANLGLGVAAAAAAVAGALWWLGAGDDEAHRDLAVTPVAGPLTGLAVEGSF
jgi:hypothetical protein